MDDHVCCNLDELAALRAENEKLKNYIRHLGATDIGYIPFICGVQGDPDGSGLADGYLICPAYGSDVVGIYKKVKASNPEY